MTDIERIQIESAIRQLEIADKWLGQIPAETTRISLQLAREGLLAAIAGASLYESADDVNDFDLQAIFGDAVEDIEMAGPMPF